MTDTRRIGSAEDYCECLRCCRDYFSAPVRNTTGICNLTVTLFEARKHADGVVHDCKDYFCLSVCIVVILRHQKNRKSACI